MKFERLPSVGGGGTGLGKEGKEGVIRAMVFLKGVDELKVKRDARR